MGKTVVKAVLGAMLIAVALSGCARWRKHGPQDTLCVGSEPAQARIHDVSPPNCPKN